MKILVLIDVYSKSPMGGAGTVLLESARGFRRAGHDVLVMCRRRQDIGDYEFIDGIPFWTFDSGEGGARGLWELMKGYRETIREIIAGQRFDAILCHHPLPLWCVAGRLPKAIPVVSVFHSPWPEEYRVMHGARATPWGRAARTWVESEALARSDRIVALSDYMRGELEGRYPAAGERASVIPGGVDLGRFPFRAVAAGERPAWAGLVPFPPSAFWVLTVRRLVPRTGVDTLIRAVARIASVAPELKLVVGGTGPLEGEYRRLAGDLGVADRVAFTGFVPESRLASLYGAADLFVLPSRTLEGFGLSILESMAVGTPVLATPVGAIPEVLGPFGREYITAGWDEASVAHALLGWSMRRAELAERRAACRRHVEERFSWDRMCVGIEKLFKQLK